MFCSLCVQLSIEADEKGLYGKDAYHMQDAVTQIDGTLFCYDHTKPYLEQKRKDRTEVEKLLNLSINEHD